MNDATALVTLGFATAAVVSGTFSPMAAAGQFVVIVVGELAFGVGVGWAMLRVRHLAEDPRAEVLLALATPFLAFWPPHAVGGSGVIACVAAGLYVSWNGRRLIRPDTRLQGYFIWNLVVWATEALVFLLAGLQARTVVDSLTSDEWGRALAAGAITTITVVVVRFVWVYPATYLPRMLVPAIRRSDAAPDWRFPFLVSFAGVRGVVSLAAALLIPLQIDGRPFPERDIVLFATYCVIALSIIGLGGALRPLVRALGLGRAGAHEATLNKQAERRVRIEGIDAVLEAIERAAQAGVSKDIVENLRRRHADRRAEIAATADERTPEDPVAEVAELQLELVKIERAAIANAYAENRITDEARRRIERELDLEEARVRHALASVGAEDG